MADKLEKVLDKTDIKHVLVTQLGDLHDVPKRWLINAVVKHVKNGACILTPRRGFRDALKKGASLKHTPVERNMDDWRRCSIPGAPPVCRKVPC